MTRRHVRCHDSLQDYTYEITEPEGRNFVEGFAPDLTPQQMLELGVFGAHYFQGEHDEFPEEWFRNAVMAETHSPKLNYFGVDASQSREEWERKGWIHEQDPRGWFQWYCRYYLGRRTADDARQMKRWKQIRRHVSQIQKYCVAGDELCRPRQRQAVLHWAYDSRKL